MKLRNILLICATLTTPTISYAGFFEDVAKSVAASIVYDVIKSAATASEVTPEDHTPAQIQANTIDGSEDDIRRVKEIVSAIVEQSTPLTERLGLYATKVDYFSSGVVNHDFIKKDREYFENKWTIREYNVISIDEVAVEPNRKYAAARYTLEYFVKRGDKEKSGTSKAAILIGSFDVQPRIYSIKEWVQRN